MLSLGGLLENTREDLAVTLKERCDGTRGSSGRLKKVARI